MLVVDEKRLFQVFVSLFYVRSTRTGRKMNRIAHYVEQEQSFVYYLACFQTNLGTRSLDFLTLPGLAVLAATALFVFSGVVSVATVDVVVVVIVEEGTVVVDAPLTVDDLPKT